MEATKSYCPLLPFMARALIVVAAAILVSASTATPLVQPTQTSPSQPKSLQHSLPEINKTPIRHRSVTALREGNDEDGLPFQFDNFDDHRQSSDVDFSEPGGSGLHKTVVIIIAVFGSLVMLSVIGLVITYIFGFCMCFKAARAMVAEDES